MPVLRLMGGDKLSDLTGTYATAEPRTHWAFKAIHFLNRTDAG